MTGQKRVTLLFGAICFVLLAALALGSCNRARVRAAVSEKERVTSSDVAWSDITELVEGNNAFAFDLYKALSNQPGNLFFSPYSISSALAMVYAGARGSTAQQMADTLHFTLPAERFHPAFNALDLALIPPGQASSQDARGTEALQLNIANALWGQSGYSFLPNYLDTLALYYGAGVKLVDIKGNPSGAADAVNQWASDQTAGRIPEVLGSFPPDLKLLLANAIYFNGKWGHPFQEAATKDEPFVLLDGGKVNVPMMHQRDFFRYTSGEAYQAIQLPYADSTLTMVIVLPQSARFQEIEAEWSSEWVQEILNRVSEREVILTMPRFSFHTPDLELTAILSALGMRDVFTQQADLSGMDGAGDLNIGKIKHKAFVEVNEKGTEAAAVTTALVIEKGLEEVKAEPIVMRIDRPFLFMIRDSSTETTLFVGRVIDPTLP